MLTLLTTPWRGLLLAAAFILAGSAVLQALNLPTLAGVLHAGALSPTWTRALEGLWLMFAVHLGIIAAYLGAAALRPTLASDGALFLGGLLLAGDTGLLGGYLGMFAGTALVGISAVLVIVARTIRRGG